MDAYYWCAAEALGDKTQLDRGGYYEKIDNGWPVETTFGGFARSDVPEVCMSKTPEACLFALAHNVEDATPLYVYQTSREPDIDISDAGWDFGVLEEVRYRNPQEDPIPVTRAASVELPQRAFDDATESYNPHGPYNDAPEVDHWNGRPVFNREWGDAVKDALRAVLDGEPYPEELRVPTRTESTEGPI